MHAFIYFIKLIIRPIRYFPIDWSLKKHIIVATPPAPSSINHYLSKEKNITYQIYGVKWNHTFTLEEITATKDFGQFDRLVYKVSKLV